MSSAMDHLTKKKRSWNMSRIRSKNTAPEKVVRKILSKLGLRYRLHAKQLPGKPDIIIKRDGVAVFINGCFWHQHKGCKRKTMPKENRDYWKPKLEMNVAKQKANIKRLKKDGWNVNTVWECETRNEARLKKRLQKIL
ncbi:MAG: DNA mismatch endonuclease Vsr [Patescibacteria group bacterium]